MKPTPLLLLLWLCLGTRLAPAFGQNITVQSSRTFTSPISGTAGATDADMIQLDRRQLFSLTPNPGPFGLIATMLLGAANPAVSLTVYSKDNDVLYSVATSVTTTTFGGTSTAISNPGYSFGTASSFAYTYLGLEDYVTSYSTFEKLGIPIPVKVVVTVTGATFVSANIPGIGLYNPLQLPVCHPCLTSPAPQCAALRLFKTSDKNQVVVAAHRGYWGYGSICEGGIASLQNAYNSKFRIVELDVMRSKDHVPVLMHDQEVNRLTSLGITNPTPDDTGDPTIDTDKAWIKNLNYKTTTPNIPKAGGGTYASYPALNTATLRDRQGLVTTEKLDSLPTALAYIAGKDLLLSLDLKDKDKDNYLADLARCLQLGSQSGLLGQMVFKPGSAAAVSVADIYNYLQPLGLWRAFAFQTNVIVIAFAADRTYVDSWLAVPSVICLEYIYKYQNNDPLLIPSSSFDNKSVIKYTKDLGYRTGINWEIPTDCRGVPNGRGTWYDKGLPDSTSPSTTGITTPQMDYRVNPEWVLAPPGDGNSPGSMVTDRPDILASLLTQYGILSPVTYRIP